MAAQFIATKWLSFLGLRLCIALAMSSLPVPLSPKINTLALLLATLGTIEYNSSIGGLLPMIFSREGAFNCSLSIKTSF